VASERPGIPFPAKKVTRALAVRELALLEAAYPQAVTALTYDSPFTLLIAVILSAQCTDARVNLTTPHLFAKYPTPAALGAAALPDVETLIKACGFFHMKAKNIVAAARAIAEHHGGEVPREREQLEALPGVGRKTASVVISVAFDGAAFAVDTHVFRVAHRLGLTLGKTPRQVEDDVVKLVPDDKLRHAHHWLILHGREICKAPTPLCGRCPVAEICPSAPIVAKAIASRSAALKGAASKISPKTTPSKPPSPKAPVPKARVPKAPAPKAPAPKAPAPKAKGGSDRARRDGPAAATARPAKSR
jgi:endonuclease-3